MKNVYSEAAVANRYDSARGLPPETMSLWMKTLRSSVSQSRIQGVLDLGCGTGRFTGALAQTFGCSATGVEPSSAMLEVAGSRSDANVEWKPGSADQIPLEDHSVDLVFMSQVFHHLGDPHRALNEIHRVLRPAGYLAVRNGTREHNEELEWLRFFPDAFQVEEARTPYADEIKETVIREHFGIVSHTTIRQIFAASHSEYLAKISGRALSALVDISDDAFQTGLEKFKQWVNQQPVGATVYEPVDLFIFQKKAANSI